MGENNPRAGKLMQPRTESLVGFVGFVGLWGGGGGVGLVGF